MKPYIHVKAISHIEAFHRIVDTLSRNLEFSDCEIAVNRSHNCIDVIFIDGSMKQIYPKRGESHDVYRYNYEYVGQGKCEHVKKSYARSRNSWKNKPNLVRYVYPVNIIL